MSTPRIYVDLELGTSDSISLPKAASHHLCNVLRNKAGDELIVFNGDGNDYRAALISTGKSARISIQAVTPNPTESPLKIHLLQGVSRNDRMDTTIQKAVELGVHSITPFFSEKGQVKLNAERLNKKLSHWTSIIIAACEQSQRSALPKLEQPVTLTTCLASLTPALSTSATQIRSTDDEAPRFLLNPQSENTIGQVQLAATQCHIMVGPESGFTEAEIQQCLDTGFQGMSLGPRVLRTETAGPAAIAVLQARYGDLR